MQKTYTPEENAHAYVEPEVNSSKYLRHTSNTILFYCKYTIQNGTKIVVSKIIMIKQCV